MIRIGKRTYNENNLTEQDKIDLGLIKKPEKKKEKPKVKEKEDKEAK
jgi:hypothetical protein